MNFASDNTAPAHPAILAALARANAGHVPSYGADPATGRAVARLREAFEAPDAAVYPVATGSAANALALACLARPWSAIFAHRTAHAATDECGAPELFTGGAKLALVDGAHGRMTPDGLRAAIAALPESDVHSVQRGPVTLTNATEAGTVYTPAEIGALCAVARDFGLPVHLDGARLANALAATGATPAEMTWKAGIDALSFGATKNGCLAAEAVILFDPAKAWEFELRRKRGAHLLSKQRFLSAQLDAYLGDGLWLDLARVANARAAQLSQGLAALPGVTLAHPAEANAVFAAIPRAALRRAAAAGAQFSVWSTTETLDGTDDAPLPVRLVCAWCTEAADVDAFLALLAGSDA